jgi:hypothetical protein
VADATFDALIAEDGFVEAEPAAAYSQLCAWTEQAPAQAMVASALQMASLSFGEDEFKNAGYGVVTGGVA